MFKKKKSTERPQLPKEYIWTLEINGEDHEYKCLVTETGVTTYEDGVEHKHLKITDPTCMEGVLQIDTQTKIFGDMVAFQLERFIPYIKLDGHWKMSETTEMDRIEQMIGIHQKNSKLEIAAGMGCFAVALGKKLITGDLGDWWMLIVFGVFFIFSAVSRMIRLKNELSAMTEAAQKEAAEKQAAQRKEGEAPEAEAETE